jgi:hypothetical protein
VVVASLEDDQVIFGDPVDESVLVVDAARPASGELMPERFGPPDPGEGLALDCADKVVDPLHLGPIGALSDPRHWRDAVSMVSRRL